MSKRKKPNREFSKHDWETKDLSPLVYLIPAVFPKFRRNRVLLQQSKNGKPGQAMEAV